MTHADTRHPDERIAAAGLELPPVRHPRGTYVLAARTGSLLFLAGHGPVRPDGSLMCGVVGADLTPEQGNEAARLTGLALLATLKDELGDLARVRRVVKLLGMVAAVPGFEGHPEVINGASDVLVEVLGEERGRHARSAVGMGSLPRGIAVEIELVVEVEPAG
ncbi:MAG: RidA family protein [Conexibacter sp.]